MKEQISRYELSLFMDQESSTVVLRSTGDTGDTFPAGLYPGGDDARELVKNTIRPKLLAVYDAFTKRLQYWERENLCDCRKRTENRRIGMEDYIVRATAANAQADALPHRQQELVEQAEDSATIQVRWRVQRWDGFWREAWWWGSMMKNPTDICATRWSAHWDPWAGHRNGCEPVRGM